MTQLNPSFLGMINLLGKEGFQKLNKAHIAVIGLGGVGSWAAETLVRSGVGHLSLMDMDEICTSNINRQITANIKSIGRDKLYLFNQRAKLINPEIEINLIQDFFDIKTADQFFDRPYDYIIDCIDAVSAKTLLIDSAQKKKIPLITCGATSSRTRPQDIVYDDLNHSINDKLLMRVRKKLKQDYNYPRGKNKKFNIPCVFSKEVVPAITRSEQSKGPNFRFQCSQFGGVSMGVSASFGLFAAQYVMMDIAGKNICS